MTFEEKALDFHKKNQGKIALHIKAPLNNKDELALAYTPGVAYPCLEIEKEPLLAYDYTSKGNMVAVVTNGTAVLGLGDIGPLASLPVMEGKSVLFKAFGGVDAFPICIDTRDSDKIVETVRLISSGFGGINLEDIKAPECFEIEARLRQVCDIPIFHDDQHGTAIVVLAGLYNALKLVGKNIESARIIINGAGSAGISICTLLMSSGAKNIIMCDRYGIVIEGDPELNMAQATIAKVTNREQLIGKLEDAVIGRDVFIGVSVANVLTKEMVETMNDEAIVFAMANPNPEILPQEAIAGGAKVVGTGRSDFDNQINNVLVFPGLFRGALDVRASEINEEMKLAAARAISELIKDEELKPSYIIPEAFDLRIAPTVACEVARAAISTGVARAVGITPEWVKNHTEELISSQSIVD